MLENCVLTILKFWEKLGPALGTKEHKNEHLSSYAHVVHTTAKQIVSRRRKNDNVFKMSKDEKCTCKACKNTAFYCQICKFVELLLLWSSCLLKLPNILDAVPGTLNLMENRLKLFFSWYAKGEGRILVKH